MYKLFRKSSAVTLDFVKPKITTTQQGNSYIETPGSIMLMGMTKASENAKFDTGNAIRMNLGIADIAVMLDQISQKEGDFNIVHDPNLRQEGQKSNITKTFGVMHNKESGKIYLYLQLWENKKVIQKVSITLSNGEYLLLKQMFIQHLPWITGVAYI